ncbi:MAG: hypothetical protein ACHQAY_21580 [Hyphomicrobiales bacterium]
MNVVTGSSSFSIIVVAAGLIAQSGSGFAAGAPPFDPRTQCVDGGLPYKVGTHLCTSEGIVEICLRPDQTYGVKGIYTYDPNAKGGTHFDKAHWIATTSSQCGKSSNGKVYTTGNPKR